MTIYRVLENVQTEAVANNFKVLIQQQT